MPQPTKSSHSPSPSPTPSPSPGPWVDAAVAALPGVLTLYLAFADAGYFAGTTGLVAAELALLVGLLFLLRRRPLDSLSVAGVFALVAFGGLAAWTLASSSWSEAAARAAPEYVRALLYVLTLGFFALLPYSARRVRWAAYGLASAIVIVAGTALVARLLPDLIFDSGLVEDDRLGYPLGYWNALGVLTGVGIVLCGHFACSARDPWPVRVLGAAAVPLLTLTLYYTASRGGTWATLGAVVIYAVVGRPRALLSGALATVGPAAVALFAANPANALTEGHPAGPTAVAAGHDMAMTLALCMGAAAVLRLALVPADGWVMSLRLGDRVRRPVLVAATTGAVAVVFAAGAVLQVPTAVGDKYDEFMSRDTTAVDMGQGRLLSAQANGRHEHWDVAMAAYRRDRLHGAGAGTYPLLWAQERQGTVHVQDAHSLYVEALGELGLPGLLLLVTGLLALASGLIFRVRGPDRALFAALLAAALGWAAAAGVDWQWEMPATAIWLFAFGGMALARRPRGGEGSKVGNLAVRGAGLAVCAVLAVMPAQLALSSSRMDESYSSLRSGDCEGAIRHARDALSAFSKRPVAYQVIGFCQLASGKPAAAARSMTAAVRLDPQNWELRYGRAVTRALAGLDPRRDAYLAKKLNPNEELARTAASRFRSARRGQWERAAAAAKLPQPGPPTP